MFSMLQWYRTPSFLWSLQTRAGPFIWLVLWGKVSSKQAPKIWKILMSISTSYETYWLHSSHWIDTYPFFSSVAFNFFREFKHTGCLQSLVTAAGFSAEIISVQPLMQHLGLVVFEFCILIYYLISNFGLK